MKFRHGLYEYALIHAAQDALRATQILPSNAQAWLRAADVSDTSIISRVLVENKSFNLYVIESDLFLLQYRKIFHGIK